jgi:hypothetical protein
MENRISEKQLRLLRKLEKEKYAPNLIAELDKFFAIDLSSQGASNLIEKFLKAPKKSESLEYKAELAEKAKQAKERAELAEQAKQAEIENCLDCKRGHQIPHFNCSFPNRIGHGKHCSADLCF